MTIAILLMLSNRSIHYFQYLLKDLVVCSGTFENMKVIFYYLFSCGIVKINVTHHATFRLTMHKLNC